MLSHLFLPLLAILASSSFTLGVPKHEQVHISLGTNESEIVVTWTTLQAVKDNHVLYGVNASQLDSEASSEETHFHKFYTHRSLLRGLEPGTKYFYKVGSKETGYSKSFHFRTLATGVDWNPRLAIYGDLGYQNEKSLPYLSQDVAKEMYDTIFHIGDIAYNLNERNCEQGHDFMRSIEPVAANVPYMTVPGNHEQADNFSHYDNRFSMLGDRHDPKHNEPLTKRLNNHFWSIDIGPAHFLMFSTEFYYYTNYGWEQIERQFRFIEEDLKRANANRKERPWIIAMGHRPFYVSNANHPEVKKSDERIELRDGIFMHNDKKTLRKYGLEKIFLDQGVDLQFYGHEHLFSRFWPVYNFKVKNGTKSKNPYDNPNGPVHIITGSAGNREQPNQHESHQNVHLPHLATRFIDYGYTRLQFEGKKKIIIEQVSDNQHGKVLDKIEYIKDEPYPHWMGKHF